MEDYRTHIEKLGIPMADSPAAADYAKTKSEDELHFAAGEHLAMHAAAITMALRLPRRGAVILSVLERMSTSRWEQYWKLQNEAFCVSALLDLCTVRTVFREDGRWPELSYVLDQVFVMCCAEPASLK